MSLNRRGMLTAALAAGAAPLLAAGARKPAFVDGMSFLPDDPHDLAASGLKAFICDVSKGETDTDANGFKFYHRKFELCDRSISDASARIAKEFPGLRIALSGKDVDLPGQATIFQFQGCEPIGKDLSRIAYFREKSLRILQLTHNESNAFATAYTDERGGRGLSDLGREGLDEINRVRLIPDVSHASEATALETVARSKAPVILSHGACRALLDHPRAATDKMIRAVAGSGGVFGVFMMSFWLTKDPTPVPEHYVAHIRHAVNVAGLESVAVANDYAMSGLKGPKGAPFENANDMEAYTPWWRSNRERGVPGFGPDPRHAVIPQLNVINRMQLIHEALLRGGFKPREADRIVGANWLAFFRTNLA